MTSCIRKYKVAESSLYYVPCFFTLKQMLLQSEPIITIVNPTQFNVFLDNNESIQLLAHSDQINKYSTIASLSEESDITINDHFITGRSASDAPNTESIMRISYLEPTVLGSYSNHKQSQPTIYSHVTIQPSPQYEIVSKYMRRNVMIYVIRDNARGIIKTVKQYLSGG